MNGCFDFKCKCGAAIAWIGRHEDMPACKKCGAMPDPETVNALGDLSQTVRRMMKMDAHFDTGPDLRDARTFAGLNIAQASKLLGITDEQLVRIEQDIDRPTHALANKMNETYAIGK